MFELLSCFWNNYFRFCFIFFIYSMFVFNVEFYWDFGVEYLDVHGYFDCSYEIEHVR